MKLPAATKKNLWKRPLKIFLAIIFFPFFFTYWVYKQNWDPKIKLGFILGFWSLVVISQVSNTPQDTTATTTQYSSEAPAITVTYPPFDKKFGNNYISAKYAKQYMDFANKTAPGAIKNVYLELSPADSTGKTDSFLTVTVNSTYWNITNESTKKKAITTCIITLRNTFSGYPHVTINDGTKIVATGELPSLNGDPKITLK